MQQIVIGLPPNYAAIKDRFPDCERKGVIFSYGDRIFNPSGISIPRPLMAHEAVHGLRQGADPDAWWARYLAEPLFMLDEEIHAHHAEYRAAVKRHGHRPRDLRGIAERLSGPLYGHAITFAQAQHAILTGEIR